MCQSLEREHFQTLLPSSSNLASIVLEMLEPGRGRNRTRPGVPSPPQFLGIPFSESAVHFAHPSAEAGTSTPVFERHYRVHELAELWGLSPGTVAKMLENEPDVLCIANDFSGRRTYRTLSVPESVALRVHKSFSQQPRETRLARRNVSGHQKT